MNMSRSQWRVVGLGIVLVLAGLTNAAERGEEVLNIDSHWRYHFAKRSAGVIYRAEDGDTLIITERGTHRVGSGSTIEVDQDGNLVRGGGWKQIPPVTGPWMRPDYDDSGWMMHRGAFFPGTPHPIGHGQGEVNRMSRLFVRGRFVAERPEQLDDLRLSVEYRGGIVVYLNGHEVARGDVGDGPVDASTMPVDYGADAVEFNPRRGEDEAVKARESRLRAIENVRLPVEHVRPGVNVLAFKVLAAAMPHEAMGDRQRPAWATLGLQDIRLQASPAGAVISNVAMPDDVQVWTTPTITDLEEFPYADPADLADGIAPIRMIAARNTVVSGQAVVSAPEPVQGLRGRLGDFTGEQGRLDLPDDAVRIRYPARTIEGMDYEMRRPDVLVDKPTGQEPVQPVWVTVRVPVDAPAGTYRATLTIEADGLSGPAEVPVELVVHGWNCPDPTAWRSMLAMVQSPHTVAWHYGVEMWSDRHMELLRPSLEMMRKLGNNLVYVNVIHPNFFSSEHGVIVFRDRGGRLEPDFTYFDRFMDAYARHVGEPRRITLVVWEPDLRSDPELTVSVLSADGTLEHRRVPMYGEDGSEAIWRPVMQGVRERVNRRGWDERAIQIGVAGDGVPTQQTIDFFEEIAPFSRWHRYTHVTGLRRPEDDGRVIMAGKSVGLVEAPYNAGWRRGNRAGGLRHGLQHGWVEDWYEPLLLFAGRAILYDNSPPVSFRLMANSQVFNRSRGLTRQGIDKWPVVNPHHPDRGARRMVQGAGGWGRLYRNKVRAVAAPGPDGALPTVRFEMLRQGFQDTEARIYLERILVDEEKLALMDTAFEQEVRDLVRAEVLYRDLDSYPPFVWTAGKDWQWRLDRLYTLAAEAQRKLRDAGVE